MDNCISGFIWLNESGCCLASDKYSWTGSTHCIYRAWVHPYPTFTDNELINKGVVKGYPATFDPKTRRIKITGPAFPIIDPAFLLHSDLVLQFAATR